MNIELQRPIRSPSLSLAMRRKIDQDKDATPVPSEASTSSHLSRLPKPNAKRPSPMSHPDIACRVLAVADLHDLPNMMLICQMMHRIGGIRLYRDTSFSYRNPFVGTTASLQRPLNRPASLLLGLENGSAKGSQDEAPPNRKNLHLESLQVLGLTAASHEALHRAMAEDGTRLPKLRTIVSEAWEVGMTHRSVKKCTEFHCGIRPCRCRMVEEACPIWGERPIDLIIRTSKPRLQGAATHKEMQFHPSVRTITVIWSAPSTLTRIDNYHGIIRNVPDTVEELTVVLIPGSGAPRWDMKPLVVGQGYELVVSLSDVCASYAKKVTVVGVEQLYSPIVKARYVRGKGWSNRDLHEMMRHVLPRDQEEKDTDRRKNIEKYIDKMRFISMVEWVAELPPTHYFAEEAKGWIDRETYRDRDRWLRGSRVVRTDEDEPTFVESMEEENDGMEDVDFSAFSPHLNQGYHLGAYSDGGETRREGGLMHRVRASTARSLHGFVQSFHNVFHRSQG